MGAHLISLLTKNFPGLKIECGADVKNFSFIKTGGNADTLLYPAGLPEFKNLVNFFNEVGLKYRILGRCSNVLFSDGGISDTLIKTDYLDKIEFDGEYVYAECGVRLAHMSLECAKNSLSGLEFACGIPGSVGGAVMMNSGAFGGQISDVITEVVTASGTVTAEQCGFDYRECKNLGNSAVLAARFKLSLADKDDIDSRLGEYSKRRSQSQPKGYTLGSTFKNPVGFKAGELIEKCGLKGFGFGGARVSEKHANFILSDGSATSADVKKLIEYIKDEVLKSFNISLEEEVKYIGGS